MYKIADIARQIGTIWLRLVFCVNRQNAKNAKGIFGFVSILGGTADTR
jgi:hypothetical protein